MSYAVAFLSAYETASPEAASGGSARGSTAFADYYAFVNDVVSDAIAINPPPTDKAVACASTM
jgi:hypothetical protein